MASLANSDSDPVSKLSSLKETLQKQIKLKQRHRLFQSDCAVSGCNSNSERDASKGIRFFSLPDILYDQPEFKDISTRRRLAWCIAINRADISIQSCQAKRFILVCSRHFSKGEPANLLDESNLDWIPNLNLQLNRVSTELMNYRRKYALLSDRPPRKRKLQGKRSKVDKEDTESDTQQSPAKQGRNPDFQSEGRTRSSPHQSSCTIEPPPIVTDSIQEHPAQESDITSDGEGTGSDNVAPDYHEVPIMNREVRLRLLSTMEGLPESVIDKSKPLAIITSHVSYDHDYVTWYCQDQVAEAFGRKLTFTLKTPLITIGGEDEQSTEADKTSENSSNVRFHLDRAISALNKVSFLPVECYNVKALLHTEKFQCPGTWRKCIELNGALVTPVELVQEACVDTKTDWQNHITIGGFTLWSAMKAKKLGFANHSTFCTQTCFKFADCLNDQVNNTHYSTNQSAPKTHTIGKWNACTTTMLMKVKDEESAKDSCCVETCRNGYNMLGCAETLSFFPLPAEQERCQVWVNNIGRVDLMCKSAVDLQQMGLLICSCHFEDHQFINPNQRDRLRSDAVPTLFYEGISQVKWRRFEDNLVKSTLKRKLLLGNIQASSFLPASLTQNPSKPYSPAPSKPSSSHHFHKHAGCLTNFCCTAIAPNPSDFDRMQCTANYPAWFAPLQIGG